MSFDILPAGQPVHIKDDHHREHGFHEADRFHLKEMADAARTERSLIDKAATDRDFTAQMQAQTRDIAALHTLVRETANQVVLEAERTRHFIREREDAALREKFARAISLLPSGAVLG